MRMMLIAILVLGGLASWGLGAEEKAVAQREALYQESLRPQFHFTARYWDEYQLNPPNHHEGWLNDLNGLVYNQGEYHLFAQRWWSAWLHAISTDLIHWQEQRPAFGKGGKFGGTQSGGGVVDLANCSGLGSGQEPPMIAFWASTDNLNQCISYSQDKGRTWTKYEKNPVLVHPFRDPKVFWFEPDKKWIMILYGPSGKVQGSLRYGFNGESNDAHDLREIAPGEWICSAVRLFDDGKVIATDQNGSSEGRVDINKQNLGTKTFCVGAKADRTEFLEGDIAEILVYQRALSDEETKRTLAALQSKWGLSGSAGTAEIATDGLVLQLDAAGAAADVEGRVAAWVDSEGPNKAMGQPEVNRRPKRISRGLGERPVIHFDGEQSLQGPAVLSEGDDSLTIIAVWRRANTNGSQVICEQNAGAKLAGRRAALLTVSRQEAENVYLLFSSTNLLNWTKLDTEIGDSFECPDMFALPVDGNANQSKWVVIDGNGDYVVGRFDGKQFTPEAKKRKGDYGRNFYATMTFENMPTSDPRRIQLAWMRGWDEYPKNMPFNQQVSFPCELTLRTLPQGMTLCRYPIHEIATIHGEGFSRENFTLRPGENPLSGQTGDLFDIRLEIDISQSTCSEIALDLNGNTVKYDVVSKTLQSVGSETKLEPRDERIGIRVLMDRLSIETFGNRGEVSITNIAYQKGQGPLDLRAIGGEAKIVSLTAQKVESIWK